MTATLDTSLADRLLAPFPTEQIGKLPRITCRDCSGNKSGVCGEHSKSRCAECGNWITERHIHLDYVGHADVTRRLLEVDPGWNWEPVAVDADGLPLCSTDADGNPVGLWIRLTVGGVTRPGYGSCPSNQSDAVKVLIGDALRNAAMRFGVAVDLWAKGDRTDPSAENATGAPARAQQRRRSSTGNGQDPELLATKADVLNLHRAAGLGSDPETIGQTFEQLTGMKWGEAKDDKEALKIFVGKLREDLDSRDGATSGAAS